MHFEFSGHGRGRLWRSIDPWSPNLLPREEITKKETLRHELMTGDTRRA